jgi:hypothetical protein
MAPLGLGLAALALGTVLVLLAIGSMYQVDRRLTSVAEATALEVLAQKSESSKSLSELANGFLARHPLYGLHEVQLLEASFADGKTVRIRLCSIWRPPIASYMFSDVGRVCSEGLARLGK